MGDRAKAGFSSPDLNIENGSEKGGCVRLAYGAAIGARGPYRHQAFGHFRRCLRNQDHEVRSQSSRAEISDAAMGERAECVMLNKGPHINEAVVVLDDILCRMAEHHYKKDALLRQLHSWRPTSGT